MVSRPLIAVTANESWNLLNFRRGLISALLQDGFDVLAIAPLDEPLVARLQGMGCRFEPIPVDPAGIHPWREIKTLWAYWHVVRRNRPAAILSWTIKPNIYGALVAGAAGAVALPNVSGLGTAFMRPGILKFFARLLYRVAFKRAKTVFFQNGDDLGLFVRSGLVAKEKAILLPGSGVDVAAFSPPSGGRPAAGHFLMIARLIADKGVREFVQAARSAKQSRKDLRFTIMGQVNVRNRTAISLQELQEWIDEGVVEYREPADDIRPAIASADFVVLPSYREGLSRVLLEAGAMGRPSITCDVPGCRDLIKDGWNGFLCAPRDALSLRNAILRAASVSEVQWRTMSEASRATVVEGFSERSVIQAYREALCRCGVIA
jgi:glycosyltransferase involved in cell wall biosynthesis